MRSLSKRTFYNALTCIAFAFGWLSAILSADASEDTAEASSSCTAPPSTPNGPLDGNRFVTHQPSLWKGEAKGGPWWWQVRFAEPTKVGAILQIVGDHPSMLQNAPKRYAWKWSNDGQTWKDLPETEQSNERRLFRAHRLSQPREVRFLRIRISECHGDAPALREVELYPETDTPIEFDDWILSVSTCESSALPGGTEAFVNLASQCSGWEDVLAQQMWIGDFDEEFCAAEPRPLCAFLTGNYKEWCQRTQDPWRGTKEVLAHRNLPMWGACGGAQGMALLEEVGVDRPWDCPRCRDPENPKSPIYSHIGHTGESPCGEYGKCVGERGKFKIRKTVDDPVFEGLPEIFEMMESHIGQIAWPPDDWVRIAAKGPGALTVNQCLRVKDRYIYAAQFHAEMAGTPENSRRVMGNFLRLAKQWGGYNPDGKPVSPPKPIEGHTH